MVEFINGQRISFDVQRNGQLVRREGVIERVQARGDRQMITIHQPHRPERQYGNYYTNEMINVTVG